MPQNVYINIISIIISVASGAQLCIIPMSLMRLGPNWDFSVWWLDVDVVG